MSEDGERGKKDMKTYEWFVGEEIEKSDEDIERIAREMSALAIVTHEIWATKINGTVLRVHPGDMPKTILGKVPVAK